MSKITHPVRVRTRIQAVPAPEGSCGPPCQGAALGNTSTAGQDVAVKRKKRDSLVKSGKRNRSRKPVLIFNYYLKSTEEGALVLQKLLLQVKGNSHKGQKSIQVKFHTKLQDKRMSRITSFCCGKCTRQTSKL